MAENGKNTGDRPAPAPSGESGWDAAVKPKDPAPNTLDPNTSDKKTKKQAVKKKSIFAPAAAIISAAAALIVVLYALLLYSHIPFFSFCRTIWIETAMTPLSHHWLATAFFPENVINEVMSNQVVNDGTIGGEEALEDDTAKYEIEGDVLGLTYLSPGDTDYAGNRIEIVDYEQGLMVSEIVGDGFKGKIMLVDDPSRVYLAVTPYKGTLGLRILEFLDTEGAVAGINASGFNDPGGNGSGGILDSLCCSGGEYWGSYVYGYTSIVLTDSDRLVVGDIRDWSQYSIRDGMQFGPVLIADGEVKVSGSAGYGLQPRTAIGQREDGVIALLVIDGRDITHSVGCTVGSVAEILAEYNVVNAACCDGGASTVLAYEGKVLNKNCSANPAYGRMLPNAFLVKRKSSEEQYQMQGGENRPADTGTEE